VNVRAWRIVKAKRAATAFDGQGARLYGGRWNNPGVAVVYTSASQSLAALEMLANLEQASLLERYVVVPADFDEAIVTAFDERTLPRDWAAQPAPADARALGDAWVASAVSAVLRVPSAVVPAESNFLLNPAHADFRRLRIGKPQRFAFDPRLVAKRR
jgi:RES domain-containing protein